MDVLWRSTRKTIENLRFYSVLTSACVVALASGFVVATAVYILVYTVYLQDDVAYHLLVWTGAMWLSSTLVFEPLWLLIIEVVWYGAIANFAQRWGFGPHALASTTQYNELVRQVDDVVFHKMWAIAATRIQRWWLGTLDMHKAISEQTAAAVKIQEIRKKMAQKKKYIKEKKWCMKVDVIDCADLQQTADTEVMSPMVRLQCDKVNPNVSQTKVAWNAGTAAVFEECFYVDIKESSSLYVSVWSKSHMVEEFVGRGYFEFVHLKPDDEDFPQDGRPVTVRLYRIEHGDGHPAEEKPCGIVNLKVTFLDPLKDPMGVEGNDWMLPKDRMKLALSQMNPDNRMRVGQLLGRVLDSGPAGGSRPGSRAGSETGSRLGSAAAAPARYSPRAENAYAPRQKSLVPKYAPPNTEDAGDIAVLRTRPGAVHPSSDGIPTRRSHAQAQEVHCVDDMPFANDLYSQLQTEGADVGVGQGGAAASEWGELGRRVEGSVVGNVADASASVPAEGTRAVDMSAQGWYASQDPRFQTTGMSQLALTHTLSGGWNSHDPRFMNTGMSYPFYASQGPAPDGTPHERGYLSRGFSQVYGTYATYAGQTQDSSYPGALP